MQPVSQLSRDGFSADMQIVRAGEVSRIQDELDN